MEKAYFQLKKTILQYFENFVGISSREDCLGYYYEIENYSEEDAILFATLFVTKFIDEENYDTDFYDHIECVLEHGGNSTMLLSILNAYRKTTDTAIRIHFQNWIDSLILNLQRTARKGFIYSQEYIDELIVYLEKQEHSLR